MKPISEVQKHTRPKILLLGHPFSGKTTLALHFPKPFVIDLDGKIANATKTIKPEVGWFDQPLTSTDPVENWAAIDKAVTAACLHEGSETVVLDSLTVVDFCLRRYVANARPTNINPVTVASLQFMSQAHWNPYEVLLRTLLAKLLAVPKIAVVTAHLDTVRDELVGGIWQVPLLPGKSQTGVPALFTDCWLVRGTLDKDGQWKTIVRTVPGGSPPIQALGTSMRLPPEFIFTPAILKEALDGGKP